MKVTVAHYCVYCENANNYVKVGDVLHITVTSEPPIYRPTVL